MNRYIKNDRPVCECVSYFGWFLHSYNATHKMCKRMNYNSCEWNKRFSVFLFSVAVFGWIFFLLVPFFWVNRMWLSVYVCVCVWNVWILDLRKEKETIKVHFMSAIHDLIWINESGSFNICNTQWMFHSPSKHWHRIFFLFVKMKTIKKEKYEWISMKNFIAIIFRYDDYVFFLKTDLQSDTYWGLAPTIVLEIHSVHECRFNSSYSKIELFSLCLFH